jgi:hypothetical protein
MQSDTSCPVRSGQTEEPPTRLGFKLRAGRLDSDVRSPGTLFAIVPSGVGQLCGRLPITSLRRPRRPTPPTALCRFAGACLRTAEGEGFEPSMDEKTPITVFETFNGPANRWPVICGMVDRPCCLRSRRRYAPSSITANWLFSQPASPSPGSGSSPGGGRNPKFCFRWTGVRLAVRCCRSDSEHMAPGLKIAIVLGRAARLGGAVVQRADER